MPGAESLPSADEQPFGFAGYVKDPETGLYYSKARYYDPAVGRFTSEDPHSGSDLEPPSLHRYLYAYANPSAYIDPSGRQTFSTEAANAYVSSLIDDPARRAQFERVGAQAVARQKAEVAADADALGEFATGAAAELAALGRDTGLHVAEAATGMDWGGTSAIERRHKALWEFATNHPIDRMRESTTNALIRADEYEQTGDYYNAQKTRAKLGLNYAGALAGASGIARNAGLGVSLAETRSAIRAGRVIENADGRSLVAYNDPATIRELEAGFSRGGHERSSPTQSAAAAGISGERMVMVYRGTARVSENRAFDETGTIMSDAAIRVYRETSDVGLAFQSSQLTHAEWLKAMGGESAYVEAHSARGLELPREIGLERTLISVTTDPAVARHYAEGGRLYGGMAPESELIKQTLGTSNESEMLLRIGTDRLNLIENLQQ
jgi:RHS repeat-associated protein